MTTLKDGRVLKIQGCSICKVWLDAQVEIVVTNYMVITLKSAFHLGLSSQNTVQIPSQIFFKNPVRGICLWLFVIYNCNTTGEVKAVFISSQVLRECFFLSSLRGVCLELTLCQKVSGQLQLYSSFQLTNCLLTCDCIHSCSDFIKAGGQWLVSILEETETQVCGMFWSPRQ